MGREIRRVSMNWEHPKEEKYNPFTRQTESHYQPMYDKDAETAWAEWLTEFEEFKKEELAESAQKYPDEYSVDAPYRSFCEYNGTPPNPKYYRPKWDDGEPMGYAVYETVSEGTPVTPTFATKEELIDYLATTGTYSSYESEPWPREAAERFVEMEWAPSFMLKAGESGVQIIKPSDPAMYETA